MNEENLKEFLPWFILQENYSTGDVFHFLGMTDAFEREWADFSGMYGRELFLSKVIHKSFVEVNEEGKEATFATAAITMLGCAGIICKFCADHPFLFYIQHSKASGIPILWRTLLP